jgi:site-specific DNA-methyltransferase (adenine-specific)
MSAPLWSDGQVTLHLGDCLDVLAGMEACSVDSIVTDPPYGLEFMQADWDTFKPGSARLRTRKDGRTNPREGKSEVTVPESYSTGAGRRGQPGIGARPADWVSNQGWNGFRCRTCGHLSHGGSPCQCETPDFARADNRWNLYQEWCTAWAAECLRVLKPGGYMTAFGGARTWHRLACAIEDAGFDIRDSMHWIYSQGFPKSLDVSKALDRAAGVERADLGPGRWAHVKAGGTWNGDVFGDEPAHGQGPRATVPATDDAARWSGWGTALKPAHEPIVVARKPLSGTVAQNVLEHGTGALNIDACRVEHGADVNLGHVQRQRAATADMSGLGRSGFTADHEQAMYNAAGRWPPNVLLGPDAAAEMDRQSGHMEGGNRPARRGGIGYGSGAGGTNDGVTIRYDAGGASRFFPVFRYQAKAPASERPRLADGTAHETVKPLPLIRWLLRLVTPPGGTCLDLFAGSGTTGEACVIEGFNCILVEQRPSSAELIRVRLSRPIQPSLLGAEAS